ncbi:hypothetical protein NDU88_003695 [Pleurodeles waltl]|uniref:Uncharacterized protein n=1 Tax=Pleurodeles waltl TaxID=8319 RepID=A0AAV7NHP2_PLEWA|nr:hypothetical protein NDU88_003695 [Pleurodeles waltl]
MHGDAFSFLSLFRITGVRLSSDLDDAAPLFGDQSTLHGVSLSLLYCLRPLLRVRDRFHHPVAQGTLRLLPDSLPPLPDS